jgi:flagellum-specific peptidoglycan hydrolase FlgJ
MIKHICATLLLACNLVTEPAPISYENKEQFVTIIKECAIDYNAYRASPMKRIPVPLVVAVAGHESGWGTSRFATEGYNFFGIYAGPNAIDYMVPKGNDSIKLTKFGSICDGVYGFMDLLSKDKRYEDFREQLEFQWFTDEIKYDELIYLIADTYAVDPGWGPKVLATIKQLQLQY